MGKRSIVILSLCVVLIGFAAASLMYGQRSERPQQQTAPVVETSAAQLVRSSSPIIGPADARTTIVEFFDPACEACRAFYPFVKDLLAEHRGKARLVLRYAPFHKGSDEAVRILETARLQGLFEPVLEALLAVQPAWAAHGAPNLSKAWEVARTAGLDEAKARSDMNSPAIDAIIQQDIADGKAFSVQQTPTFFVNGKPLTKFGRDPLRELIELQVAASG